MKKFREPQKIKIDFCHTDTITNIYIDDIELKGVQHLTLSQKPGDFALLRFTICPEVLEIKGRAVMTCKPLNPFQLLWFSKHWFKYILRWIKCVIRRIKGKA